MATREATYFYLFSENYGRTYRTVAIVGEAERAAIEARPLTANRYVRRFDRI